jgi:hypothetical protein
LERLEAGVYVAIVSMMMVKLGSGLVCERETGFEPATFSLEG